MQVSGVHQFPVDPPGLDLLPLDAGHESGERLGGVRLNALPLLNAPQAGVQVGEQIEGVVPEDSVTLFLW